MNCEKMHEIRLIDSYLIFDMIMIFLKNLNSFIFYKFCNFINMYELYMNINELVF